MLWPAVAMLAVAALDLPQLEERGTLRVLVFGSEEEFLPRAGSPKARDRELLAEFADRAGLRLELVVEDDFDRLFPRLLEGEVDVVAHGLTVTPERKQVVAFTRPVATVRQLVVGKKGAKGNPRRVAELSGRTVTVHLRSAYAQTLEQLRIKGLTIAPAPEGVDSEEVVYQVGRGELALTVTDSNLFASIASYNRDVQALFAVAEGREQAWALRPDAPRLKAALDAFLVEKALTSYAERHFTGDLDAIRKRGVLRLLTWNDPVSYFAWRGQLFGFDYELAKLLAARLRVRLEVVVPPQRSQLVPWLLEGRGDLIAAAMHPAKELTPSVTFSSPYLFSNRVQVGAGPAVTLSGGPGIDAELDDADLVEQVRAGTLSATVVDQLLLDAMAPLPQSVPRKTLATEEPIVFVTRPSSKKLSKAVDAFVEATYRGLEYNLLKQRYFEAKHPMASARAEAPGPRGQLSPFDAKFREHASKQGLDWRLLAAQSFEESRFDPMAKSWVGALGLFQLMPGTAAELGVKRREDPDESIRAGAEYLARLASRLDSRLELQQRLRFALAAYNVGLGHVLDAQRLAAERGLDPTKWFGHVEKAMLLLEQPAHYRRARNGYCRGSEPVKYVSSIQARYDGYVHLVP